MHEEDPAPKAAGRDNPDCPELFDVGTANKQTVPPATETSETETTEPDSTANTSEPNNSLLPECALDFRKMCPEQRRQSAGASFVYSEAVRTNAVEADATADIEAITEDCRVASTAHAKQIAAGTLDGNIAHHSLPQMDAFVETSSTETYLSTNVKSTVGRHLEEPVKKGESAKQMDTIERASETTLFASSGSQSEPSTLKLQGESRLCDHASTEPVVSEESSFATAKPAMMDNVEIKASETIIAAPDGSQSQLSMSKSLGESPLYDQASTGLIIPQGASDNREYESTNLPSAQEPRVTESTRITDIVDSVADEKSGQEAIEELEAQLNESLNVQILAENALEDAYLQLYTTPSTLQHEGGSEEVFYVQPIAPIDPRVRVVQPRHTIVQNEESIPATSSHLKADKNTHNGIDLPKESRGNTETINALEEPKWFLDNNYQEPLDSESESEEILEESRVEQVEVGEIPVLPPPKIEPLTEKKIWTIRGSAKIPKRAAPEYTPRNDFSTHSQRRVSNDPFAQSVGHNPRRNVDGRLVRPIANVYGATGALKNRVPRQVTDSAGVFQPPGPDRRLQRPISQLARSAVPDTRLQRPAPIAYKAPNPYQQVVPYESTKSASEKIARDSRPMTIPRYSQNSAPLQVGQNDTPLTIPKSRPPPLGYLKAHRSLDADVARRVDAPRPNLREMPQRPQIPYDLPVDVTRRCDIKSDRHDLPAKVHIRDDRADNSRRRGAQHNGREMPPSSNAQTSESENVFRNSGRHDVRELPQRPQIPYDLPVDVTRRCDIKSDRHDLPAKGRRGDQHNGREMPPISNAQTSESENVFRNSGRHDVRELPQKANVHNTRTDDVTHRQVVPRESRLSKRKAKPDDAPPPREPISARELPSRTRSLKGGRDKILVRRVSPQFDGGELPSVVRLDDASLGRDSPQLEAGELPTVTPAQTVPHVHVSRRFMTRMNYRKSPLGTIGDICNNDSAVAASIMNSNHGSTCILPEVSCDSNSISSANDVQISPEILNQLEPGSNEASATDLESYSVTHSDKQLSQEDQSPIFYHQTQTHQVERDLESMTKVHDHVRTDHLNLNESNQSSPLSQITKPVLSMRHVQSVNIQPSSHDFDVANVQDVDIRPFSNTVPNQSTPRRVAKLLKYVAWIPETLSMQTIENYIEGRLSPRAKISAEISFEERDMTMCGLTVRSCRCILWLEEKFRSQLNKMWVTHPGGPKDVKFQSRITFVLMHEYGRGFCSQTVAHINTIWNHRSHFSTSMIDDMYQKTLRYSQLSFWFARQNNQDFIVLKFFFKNMDLCKLSLDHRSLSFVRSQPAPLLELCYSFPFELEEEYWVNKTCLVYDDLEDQAVKKRFRGLGDAKKRKSDSIELKVPEGLPKKIKMSK